MTTDDFEHLRDFHDLSADMRARLGRDEHRNLTIVKQYLDNREKYGKTLVFTTDVEGAWRLADAFRARLPEGVDAAYVASWRPDAKDDDPVDDRRTLQRYRDPKSGLDILINVEMFTEGVDLPMTRTVFLARPTSSEILLRQMIGRALRGPAAGGHKEAHIVSFEDHFEPPPSNPLRPGPHHDLPKLFAEMLEKGSELLGKRLQHDGQIEWSRRIIKGWFGVAHTHGALTGRVRINCLLNSIDFSAETLRFLLWHEYLHVYLKQQGHTAEFRRFEGMWPDFTACNREMDGLHEKFGVQYWYW